MLRLQDIKLVCTKASQSVPSDVSVLMGTLFIQPPQAKFIISLSVVMAYIILVLYLP